MEEQFEKTIRENLFKIRIERKLSQGYIGGVLHISQPAYLKMENGPTSISAAQLGVLADFYKIKVYLFYRKNMVSETYADWTKEQYEQFLGQQRAFRVLQDVSEKRIAELEAKVARKDAKIEALLRRDTAL